MTKRYFYTDPLAAAWMAKHFGVEIEGLEYSGNESWLELYFTERLYIHPDSLHLLEPQGDDLIQIGDDMIFRVCDNDAFWEQHKDDPCLKYNFMGIVQARCFFDDQQAKVLQRDGKPFFWPESEEA